MVDYGSSVLWGYVGVHSAIHIAHMLQLQEIGICAKAEQT